MSQTTTQEFGKWRERLWPIHRFELKKLLPMIFMFAVTITALVFLIVKTITQGEYILTIFAVGLLVVAVLLIILAFKRFGFRRQAKIEPTVE